MNDIHNNMNPITIIKNYKENLELWINRMTKFRGLMESQNADNITDVDIEIMYMLEEIRIVNEYLKYPLVF